MQEIRHLGSVPWTRNEMREAIPLFLELVAQKPIQDNQGGMRSPHLFATWFMLKKLNPTTVIESGVWKGLGTWLIEQTLPNAKIFSIDVNLEFREYKSENARYFDKDFSKLDWSMVKDKENTVLFFDDHQSAFDRIKQGKALGFKQFIFEDNYPAQYGDCYSLKKAFQHAGFKPGINPGSLLYAVKQMALLIGKKRTKPNAMDARYLKNVLEIYYEFPPVFKNDVTRWGDAWDETNYPTPDPLFTKLEQEYLRIFQEEATQYTWICLATLK